MLGNHFAAIAGSGPPVGLTFAAHLNNRLDAAVTIVFAALVILTLSESEYHWRAYGVGCREPDLKEASVDLSRQEAEEGAEERMT